MRTGKCYVLISLLDGEGGLFERQRDLQCIWLRRRPNSQPELWSRNIAASLPARRQRAQLNRPR